MKIAAVVILYNPTEEVIDNIQSYLDYVEKLYVLDNTEKQKEELINQISFFSNIIYLSDRENKGIAVRLNQVSTMALEDGFKWLLTMDQDSSFSQSSISAYITCLQELADKEHIAMTGVEIIKKNAEKISCRYNEVTSLITSGSIVNLTLFNEIGPFDEALFIDQVDLEYCYRAVLKGYKIIQFENIFLKHSLGISSVHVSLKTLKKTYRSLHSPLRMYYLTRNYLYMKLKYKESFPNEISLSKKDLFIRIKNNLLYGKERMAVITYILKGVIDFKRKKMGKIASTNSLI